MPDATAPAAPGFTFANVLREVEDGRVLDDLTREVQKLAAEMYHHAMSSGGKPKGRLSLTLNFVLVGGVFEVTADVKAAPPKPVRMRSLMYRTADGGLSVNNPRQPELPFTEPKDVSSPPARAIRSI